METSIPQETNVKIESVNIEQDNKKYLLTMKIKGEELTLVLSDPEIKNLSFSKIMKFEEIKALSGFFNGLKSCEQFCKYLKDIIDKKLLTIIKKEENLCLTFTVEYFFEKNLIELDLLPKEKSSEELIQELDKEVKTLKDKIKILENKESVKNENIIKELKNDNDKLKEEIKKLKEEIKEMKLLIEPLNKRFKEININKYTTYNDKSVIMKEEELNFINQALKFRINKEVKEIRKLYQATVHGDSANSFHSKCDGIPNTLVIIKSAGNRRFGGFTTKTWSSEDNYNYETDKNAFLFSLDKQKIYPYKGKEIYYSGEDKKYAIGKYKHSGPMFGGYYIYNNNNYGSYVNKFDIFICSNCIQGEKSSCTYESNSNSCYDFYGDKNALSEDGKQGGIYIAEYEVFQVIFE